MLVVANILLPLAYFFISYLLVFQATCFVYRSWYCLPRNGGKHERRTNTNQQRDFDKCDFNEVNFRRRAKCDNTGYLRANFGR